MSAIFQICWSQTKLCVIKQSERNLSCEWITIWIRRFSWFCSRIRLISFTLAMVFNAREDSQWIMTKSIIWFAHEWYGLFLGGTWQVINERKLRDDSSKFLFCIPTERNSSIRVWENMKTNRGFWKQIKPRTAMSQPQANPAPDFWSESSVKSCSIWRCAHTCWTAVMWH